jgi:hypothetical protein
VIQEVMTDYPAPNSTQSVPLSGLSGLTSSYTSTNPAAGDHELAYDIWLESTRTVRS